MNIYLIKLTHFRDKLNKDQFKKSIKTKISCIYQLIKSTLVYENKWFSTLLLPQFEFINCYGH